MRISKFLFGDSPAAFQTKLSLDESVRRLSSAVERHGFLSYLRVLKGQRAFGGVSTKRVRLMWMTPYFPNNMLPRFAGRFESKGAGVVLVGKFGVSPVIKAWACTFAVGGVLGAGVVLAQADTGAHSRPLLLLVAGGISAAGFVAVRVSQWITRGVRQKLGSFITDTLSAGG